MLRIGLTGGIASGKSAAADAFSDLGVPVIDTDELARDVVQPGEPGLAAVVAAFGKDMLAGDGSLDRARLRRVVFADESKRRQLEALLHPLIRQRTAQALESAPGPYQVVVVPLLVETGFDQLVDRVLVIDIDPQLQRERLAQRDGASPAEVEQILRSQASRSERMAAADDVIENSGTLSQLAESVRALHRRYLALSTA